MHSGFMDCTQGDGCQVYRFNDRANRQQFSKLHRSPLVHELCNLQPMRLCTVCCCLGFAIVSLMMMQLKAVERRRAVSGGFSYVSLSIRIADKFYGRPSGFDWFVDQPILSGYDWPQIYWMSNVSYQFLIHLVPGTHLYGGLAELLSCFFSFLWVYTLAYPLHRKGYLSHFKRWGVEDRLDECKANIINFWLTRCLYCMGPPTAYQKRSVTAPQSVGSHLQSMIFFLNPQPPRL